MRKAIFILLLSAFTTNVFAQSNSANQALLAKKLETIKMELASMEALLLATADDTTKFSGTLVDSVYVIQRSLEDISYSIYERTDYPIVVPEEIITDESGLPMDTTLTDIDAYPPPPPPTRGGMGSGGNPLSKYMQSKSPRTILRLGIGVGLTDMADLSQRNTSTNYPRFDFNKSYYRSYQVILETRLGKRDTLGNFFGSFNPKKPWKRQDQFKDNKLSLRFGITIDRYRVKEVGSNELTVGNNQQTEFAPLGFNAKDNNIYINYLSFPLLMQYKVGKKAVLQGGVFGAIRTSAKQIVVYSQNNFDFERIKIDEFALAKFNYGFQASVGLDGIQMTGKFFMNPLFKDNDLYDFRLFSYGITISM
jgi:hypothetical protein